MKKMMLCLSLLAAPAFADFSNDRNGPMDDRDLSDRFGDVFCVAKSGLGDRGRRFYGVGPNRMIAASSALRRCRMRSLLPFACRIDNCDRSGRGDDRRDDGRRDDGRRDDGRRDDGRRHDGRRDDGRRDGDRR